MPDSYTDRFDFSEALAGKPKPVIPEPKAEQTRALFTEESQPEQQPVVKGPEPTSRIKKSSGKKGQAGQKADDKTAYVRIPKSLAAAVRAMMSADNNHDAISAYLYITMGRTIAVPDHIKEIAAGYEDDAGVSDLQREVLTLQQQIRSMTEQLASATQLVSESQMILVWLMGDKLGYGVNMTAVPEKMDFLFPEYDSLLRRVKQQSLEHIKQLKLREGREVYQARFGKEKP